MWVSCVVCGGCFRADAGCTPQDDAPYPARTVPRADVAKVAVQARPFRPRTPECPRRLRGSLCRMHDKRNRAGAMSCCCV